MSSSSFIRHLSTSAVYLARKSVDLAEQIESRARHLTYAGGETFSALFSGALFTINGISDCLLAGHNPSIGRATTELARGTSAAIQRIYLNGLKAIYPKAFLDPETPSLLTYDAQTVYNSAIKDSVHVPERCLTFEELPKFIVYFAQRQRKILDYLNQSSWWINKQISVRLTAVLLALSALVWGTVVLLLTALPLFVSLITLGTRPEYNKWSYDNLRTTGWMLNQIHLGFLALVRPDLI